MLLRHLITVLLAALVFNASAASHNELTAKEKADGWELLFDGKTTKGWRNFKKTTFPEKGWVVEDGWLKHVQAAGGGDIMTDQAFEGDWELQWEWKIPEKANNGIKYFITEQRSGPIGHEYQMIDDAGVKDPRQSTASFYDVLPPVADKGLKSPGEVNHSRVVVKGNTVEHWLNGKKALTYELGSESVRKAVNASKFKNVEGFGTKIKGHILLTDHKDEACFRNIKIRQFK